MFRLTVSRAAAILPFNRHRGDSSGDRIAPDRIPLVVPDSSFSAFIPERSISTHNKLILPRSRRQVVQKNLVWPFHGAFVSLPSFRELDEAYIRRQGCFPLALAPFLTAVNWIHLIFYLHHTYLPESLAPFFEPFLSSPIHAFMFLYLPPWQWQNLAC